ncbi:MAG: Holliday junction resolvase RuvX [Patescibacteria group bacterium]
MRRLGIDYGRKRVGVALSDVEGNFAYPLVVLANDSKLLPRITEICQSEGVGEIVLASAIRLCKRF